MEIALIFSIAIILVIAAALAGGYRYKANRKNLPPGTFDKKRLNHRWQPLSLAPANDLVLANTKRSKSKKLLEHTTPQELLPKQLLDAMAEVGLPLLDKPGIPPTLPERGILLLEIPERKLQKILKDNGQHIQDDPDNNDKDSDFRGLLSQLRELGIISAWHGIPGVGVHVLCEYEQLLWFYTWLDWKNKRLTTGLGRTDLHTWV